MYDAFEDKKRTRLWVKLFVAFLFGMAVFGTAVYLVEPSVFSLKPKVTDLGKSSVEQQSENVVQASFPLGSFGPNTISDIVKQTGDAIVKIETSTKSRVKVSPFFDDPFFRQFFDHEFAIPDQERVATGLGSGFIISDEGYILTNQHVIEGADEVRVIINGFKEPVPAKVIGEDYDLDLAILQIKTDKKLPVLELGDSSKVDVGDWVIAIGNPYGLDHTVTVGVVSAKGRPVDIGDRHYKNLLQTDASINPGNSGGPLLNLNGEVVGINTAINAQAQGIGFAIPTSTVKDVLQDLIEQGKVIRPYIGVSVQSVDEKLAEYFGLKRAEGAIIAGVVPDSPADEAGLERGDIILEINKKSVKDADTLIQEVKKLKIGDEAVLLIYSQGNSKYITIKIGEK